MIQSTKPSIFLCEGYFKPPTMTRKEFEEIYNQYFWLIYKYVNERLNGDTYTTQEVLSHVFMKLWESQPTLKSKNATIGWLGLTAKRRILDLKRYAKRHPNISLEDMSFDQADEHKTENYLIEQGVITEIFKLVDTFTPNEKTIFNLYYKDNISTPKIATQLNLSPSTVRSYLQILRDKIRAKIKKGR